MQENISPTIPYYYYIHTIDFHRTKRQKILHEEEKRNLKKVCIKNYLSVSEIGL